VYRIPHGDDVTIAVSVVLEHPTPGHVGHLGLPVMVLVGVLGHAGFLQGTVVVVVMVVVQSSGAIHLI